MKTAMRIAIVGYGTAGQALAVALSRDDHRVEVFERVAEPGPVGAGFLLQPTGLSVLWELDLLDAALRHGAVVTRLFGETVAARPVMDMRYRELHPALFGLGMQRGAIFQLLDAAWTQERRLHCGRGWCRESRKVKTITLPPSFRVDTSAPSWFRSVNGGRCIPGGGVLPRYGPGSGPCAVGAEL